MTGERVLIVEDERLLVVDKPAGLAVHGGSGVSFGVIETLRANGMSPAEFNWIEDLAYRVAGETLALLEKKFHYRIPKEHKKDIQEAIRAEANNIIHRLKASEK